MITATCYTNLDKYKGSRWPSRFIELPKVGDFVRCRDTKLELRVNRIIHCSRTIASYEDGVYCLSEKANILLELGDIRV